MEELGPNANPETMRRPACDRCAHPEMRSEFERRAFWWRCSVGHVPMELCHKLERVLMAPIACKEWKQWQPGTPGTETAGGAHA